MWWLMNTKENRNLSCVWLGMLLMLEDRGIYHNVISAIFNYCTWRTVGARAMNRTYAGLHTLQNKLQISLHVDFFQQWRHNDGKPCLLVTKICYITMRYDWYLVDLESLAWVLKWAAKLLGWNWGEIADEIEKSPPLALFVWWHWENSVVYFFEVVLSRFLFFFSVCPQSHTVH